MNIVNLTGYVLEEPITKIKTKGGIEGVEFALSVFRNKQDVSDTGDKRKARRDFVQCKIFGKPAINFLENSDLFINNKCMVLGSIRSMKGEKMMFNYVLVHFIFPTTSVLDFRIYQQTKQQDHELKAEDFDEAEDDCVQDYIIESEEMPL